jgi:uncharacterized protein YdhG (YjbR/CyaY superfamily)
MLRTDLHEKEHTMKARMGSAGKAADGPEAVDAYLDQVPEPARTTLQRVRATIRAAVPKESTEGLSYGMPAFRYKGALVAYAAFKDHCSFFPMQASLIDQMKDELAGYRTSKGTLQFAVDKPLPATLVKKMVKARVAENDRKKAR